MMEKSSRFLRVTVCFMESGQKVIKSTLLKLFINSKSMTLQTFIKEREERPELLSNPPTSL